MPQKNKLDFSNFFSITPEVWKAKILEELKTDSEAILDSTSGDLIIKGFYTAEDLKDLTYLEDFHKHFTVKSPRHWYTSEWIPDSGKHSLSELVKEALVLGADCFSFDLSKEIKGEEILKLLPIIPNDFAPSLFYLQSEPGKAIGSISSALDSGAKGSLILRKLFENTIEKNAVLKLYEQSFKNCESLARFKSLGIDICSIQEKELGAPLEIAYGIGLAIDIIDHLSDQGIKVKDILPDFSFTFSIGKNYFVEIAKLRAFRLLWQSVTAQTDASFDSFATPVHTITSAASFGEDPYYNILYNTTSAMAAIIGGCDSIAVTPFTNTSTPDSFSRRISRNISFILKEEAHFDYVCDPAGGAYIIEHLTHQIAEKSLHLLQKIESKGGILQILEKEGQL